MPKYLRADTRLNWKNAKTHLRNIILFLKLQFYKIVLLKKIKEILITLDITLEKINSTFCMDKVSW